VATLKDIAEKAGVSIGTIDRIIHNRGRFSSVTADKVRQIMEEVDYRPNIMARQLSRAGNCRIGAFLPKGEQDSGYWNLPLSGMRRAERDLEPFGLSLEVMHYDRYNPDSFLEAGSRLMNGDFDGILMAPLRDADALRLMERMPTDRPVLFFDTDLPESRRSGYIGQDSYMSGKLGARLINMMAGETTGNNKSRYLIVAPETENEHLDNRIRGFEDGALSKTEILRIAVESDHNMADFRQRLEARLESQSISKIKGLFVIDASVHFTAEYLADHHGDSRVPLVGYDLVPENRRWLENGVIDFLLTQRPAEQGYRGINRLFRKIFLGEDCPSHEYTPIDIITKENLIYLTEEEIQ
jgi:LacI family transcriptional regulator